MTVDLAEHRRVVAERGSTLKALADAYAQIERLEDALTGGARWRVARVLHGPCVRCGQNVRRGEAFEHRHDLAVRDAIEHAAACPDPYAPGDVITVRTHDGRTVPVTITDPEGAPRVSTDHRAAAEDRLAEAARLHSGSSAQQGASLAAIGHGLLALLDAVSGEPASADLTPDPVVVDELIGGGPTKPKPFVHVYTSTACKHAEISEIRGWVTEAKAQHEHCRGACKHCGAACGCACHEGSPS